MGFIYFLIRLVFLYFLFRFIFYIIFLLIPFLLKYRGKRYKTMTNKNNHKPKNNIFKHKNIIDAEFEEIE